MALIARAQGEGPSSALAEPTSHRLEEAMNLETAIDHLEPLGFVLRGLISRLCERLALRGLACEALDLRSGARGTIPGTSTIKKFTTSVKKFVPPARSLDSDSEMEVVEISPGGIQFILPAFRS